MKVFTATNGILFTITEDGVLRWEGGYDPRRVTDALREYFQRERDTQLGRWRDPQNPDIVCYPVACDLDAVWVMYEGDWTRYHASRSGWEDVLPHYVSETAGRYFQAHPDPNPWRTAQPDEVWVLTDGDRSEVFRCGERGLYSLKTGNPLGSLLSCGSNKITAGRRVWPEGEASE